MVDYEVAVKKPFTDLGKLIIGIIISFIPLVNWIAKGFIIESSGMGKAKPSKDMPAWKEWGSLFFKGFAAFAIAFIYAIPALLVLMAGAGVGAVSLANTYIGTVIPTEMISSVIAGETPPGVIGDLVSENWYLAMPTIATLAPIIIVGLALLLVALYITPVAVLNYLKTKKFSKAFDMEYVFNKAMTSKYFVVWIVAGIISMVASAILNLIPLVGAQIAFFVSGVISYSLYGNVLREIKNKK